MIKSIRRLFEGAGEMLKNIIAITFLIELIISIIGMFVLIVIAIYIEEFGLIVLALLSPFISISVFWISNIPLYAFAELVVNSYNTNKDTEEKTYEENTDEEAIGSNEISLSDDDIFCEICGAVLKEEQKTCHVCGTKTK